MLGSYTGEYPKIAAGVGNTRLETPQRLTVQTPAPARGTYVRLSRDPWGGPERTTSRSRLQKGEAGQEKLFSLSAMHILGRQKPPVHELAVAAHGGASLHHTTCVVMAGRATPGSGDMGLTALFASPRSRK